MLFNAYIISQEVLYIHAYCLLCLICAAIIVTIFWSELDDEEKLIFSMKKNNLESAINEVLHYIWDPIGIQDMPAARDEYESYA
jgi:hypothetical protein